MSPVVEFCSVSKCFGSKLLVDNVSFKLHQKEITTLIGQNGAGKTTIAKMILGLEKHTQGQIRIKDYRVATSAWSPSIALAKYA